MKKFDLFIIVKWIIGLYIMGILLNLTTYLLSFVQDIVYVKLLQSNFMTIELVDFADLIRQQLIPLLIGIPFMVPGAVILLIINYVIKKTKVFDDKNRKVYMIIFSTLTAMMSLSVFLLS